MAKKVILTIDDEEHILDLLEYNLEKNGYEVLRAETGEKGLAILKTMQVDLVLLDYMLPGMDGIEVLKEMRADKNLSTMPVIMLTAKGEEIDKVLGLEMGADDYISKPFGIRELLARVKALLRRSSLEKIESEPEDKITAGDLLINNTSREVYMDGKPVFLSLKEFELLYLFASHRNRVFTREQLLELIWGYEYSGETRTVDVHVRNLRKKIEKDPDHPQYIQTVRGMGYKFV
ncbi:winged helix-turn-helix domain-containing protein [Laedolimicola sp.]|uniref:winged helix-turn-helix domain-containing protein n=1 Tax=Laedolimicola sp. TaxID=2981663 RepID=UPI003F7E488A